jgi:hypothetical protein
MTKRQIVLTLALIMGALLAVPCLFFGFWGAASAGSDKGSSELAEKWRSELRNYQTPEEAVSKNKDVIIVRFANGEWVFGLCQSSHGVWKRGGGTVVVKDSNGQIRAFFGHVCGEGALGAVWEHDTLDRYYRTILDPAETSFVEHKFP